MISAKHARLIPIELINEIILISNNAPTPEDFIRDISLLLFNYIKIDKKLTVVGGTKEKRSIEINELNKNTEDQNSLFKVKAISGISYYYSTIKAKYISYNKLNAKNNESERILGPILSIPNIDPRIISQMIQDSLSAPYSCIFISDKLSSNRIYGVIFIIFEQNIESSLYETIVELSHSLSYFISKLFSYNLKNYLYKAKTKTYQDVSLVKGFKDKIIYYKILEGLTKVVPFDHSATVYLFNPTLNKLIVHAEKNSESNPEYDEDKKKYYGGQQFNFSSEEFKSIDQSKSISISVVSPPWLTRVLSYKSKKIKNILLSKFSLSPDKEFQINDHALCGIFMLCNYSDNEFTSGDIRAMNYFLGVNDKNQIKTDSFYHFLKRIRENFIEMSPQLDLTALNNANLENLLINMESKIEDYLKELAPTIIAKDGNKKVSNISVFFTQKLNPVGKFSTLSQTIQKYLLSESFLNELDNSFYNIYSTTENEFLKEEIFGIKWNTFTAVKIKNSQNIQCLCILREVIFDISLYDRLIVRFLSEHIGLAISDYNSIEMLNKTSEYLQEIIKLGANNPSLSIENYLDELLNIAIKYTDSRKGNIYTISGDSELLELMAQNGEGTEIKKLEIAKNIGVVTYVAQNYLDFKNKPFCIDDIPAFINEHSEIVYIAALSSMSSELTIPMFLGEDLWGILNVESDKRYNYDEQKKFILLNISQKASEIWQQKQLSFALEQTGVFLKATLDESVYVEEPDIYKICGPQIKILLDIAIKSTSAHSITVRFLDDSADSLILYCQSDLGKKSSKDQIFFIEKPNCVVFTAIKLGEPIDITSVKNADKVRYTEIEYFETKEGTESEYAVPLRYFKRVDGVLNVEGAHAFTESEKLMYRTIAKLIELLLIQRVYLNRRQNFDPTSLISLRLHQLDNKFILIKKHIEEFQDSKIDISALFKKIEERADSGQELIKPLLRIPEITSEPIRLEAIVLEIKSLLTLNCKILPEILVDKSLLNNYVTANMEQLRVILKDLLDNALREGSIVKIVFQKKWNGNLQILIEDDGNGIPIAIRKKLFKLPIKRDKKLSMGCFISGIIFTDLGGRIYIYKTGQTGTTIGIDIPFND
jgi:putative methionine-R-sulfoxide reductase with GAF domain